MVEERQIRVQWSIYDIKTLIREQTHELLYPTLFYIKAYIIQTGMKINQNLHVKRQQARLEKYVLFKT